MMNYKTRISILTVALASCCFYGQEKEVSYLRDDKNVTEQDDWDYKLVKAESQTKTKRVLTTEYFNREKILVSKSIIESSTDKKKGRIYTEKYFPEHNSKTISEMITTNDDVIMTEKCVDLKGKIIYSDRECEERNDNRLDEAFSRWMSNAVKEEFQSEDDPLKFTIQFTVKPNYAIVVNKINDKKVTENEENLSMSEKKATEIIKKIPVKFFEGKLRKNAGQITKTQFSIPIIWMGTNY